MSDSNLPAPVPAIETTDLGRVVFGAGYRLPALPADTADSGRITFGAGYRLPIA